jgi:hypothetical protein
VGDAVGVGEAAGEVPGAADGVAAGEDAAGEVWAAELDLVGVGEVGDGEGVGDDDAPLQAP